MGFSTLLDIMGSVVIGGFLLMILFRLNDATVKNTFVNGDELIVQQNLVEVVRLVEYDFRKIGYCYDYQQIPDPTTSIIYADNDSIVFKTDIANPPLYPYGDGIVDTLRYYLGSTSELLSTPNPDDRILYRVVNNETPKGANLGITSFYLNYYGALGEFLTTPVANPGAISTIQIDIQIESFATYKDVNKDEDEYSTVFWRQIRLVARNLSRR